MNTTARIILLNGAGSAGKSSIARALQAIATEPFLHVQMDAFMEMLPEAYHEHPDGFTYETMHEDGRPLVVIKTGPVGERTLRGMRHAIAAMAGQGTNLVVDDVILGSARADYADLLSNLEVFMPLFPRCHSLQRTPCADSGRRISSIDADGWARDGGRDG